MNMHMNFAPPSNIEAEQALLGAILIRNTALDAVIAAGLKSSHFYEPVHAVIFDACVALIDDDKIANPVTVKALLPAGQMIAKMTAAQYLARLATEAITVSQAADYAGTVIQAARCRDLMGAGQRAMEAGSRFLSDVELNEELDAIANGIDMLRAHTGRMKDSTSAGASYLEIFDKAAKAKEIAGVPIGIKELAKVLSETTFEVGNLYGLLSSSGEGKTSLTLQLIMAALKAGHPVLFLSYDQSPAQIVRQWIAQEYGIEVRRQRQPAKLLDDEDQTKCVQFAQWIDRQPIEIIRCHREGIKPVLAYIRGFHRRQKANGKERFVVLDHIGKVTPRDPRLDAGSISGEITVELKAAADQCHSAIFVLNQRNTAGTIRDNPRPIAKDLYGGQGARADYDAIAYLYNAALYKAERVKTAATDADWKKINKVFGTDQDIADKAELGAIKCRFGPANITEEVKFEAKFTRYVSIQPPIDDARML